MVDLSTIFPEEGNITGSFINVPIISSKNSSGGSANSSSSAFCCTLSFYKKKNSESYKLACYLKMLMTQSFSGVLIDSLVYENRVHLFPTMRGLYIAGQGC